MMDKNAILDLEMFTLQRLTGKLSLMQAQNERESAVKAALEQVLNDEGRDLSGSLASGESKDAFIKDLLSYGIIEDLLYSADVEDILINALKPIYIHHSQKGLICTDRSFQGPKELNNFIRKLLVFSAGKVITR